MDSPRDAAARGALAGLIGTATLAVISRVITPRLAQSMRPDAFVPREAIRWAAARSRAIRALPGPVKRGLPMALHLAYGSLMGALYGTVPFRAAGNTSLLYGSVFGATLWAVGFQGWLPALGIRPRDVVPRKWVAPIMGHLLYGNITSLSVQALEGRRARLS